ncbi:MAG: META domain-containing protein [Weeksellaceae bacterium]
MKYLLTFLIAFFIMSCNFQKPLIHAESDSNGEITSQNENPLLGKWTLEYMSPVSGKDVKQLYKIQMPYLTFVDDVKVAGNNGCNNVAGEYSMEGGVIHFDTEKFRSTRLFCEGVDEDAFFSILKTVNRYSVIDQGEKLIFLTSDIISMIFVKTE